MVSCVAALYALQRQMRNWRPKQFHHFSGNFLFHSYRSLSSTNLGYSVFLATMDRSCTSITSTHTHASWLTLDHIRELVSLPSLGYRYRPYLNVISAISVGFISLACLLLLPRRWISEHALRVVASSLLQCLPPGAVSTRAGGSEHTTTKC